MLQRQHGAQVVVPVWDNCDGKAKGADDLIKLKGEQAYLDALEAAAPLADFEKAYAAEHRAPALRCATKGARKSLTTFLKEKRAERHLSAYQQLGENALIDRERVEALCAIEEEGRRRKAARKLLARLMQPSSGALRQAKASADLYRRCAPLRRGGEIAPCLRRK